jgi:hypothetical protein
MSDLVQIQQLLTAARAIAILWFKEDVQTIRPDLTPDQCWEVLQHVERHHDAELGINWQSLTESAELLFGSSASPHHQETRHV